MPNNKEQSMKAIKRRMGPVKLKSKKTRKAKGKKRRTAYGGKRRK